MAPPRLRVTHYTHTQTGSFGVMSYILEAEIHIQCFCNITHIVVLRKGQFIHTVYLSDNFSCPFLKGLLAAVFV